jgi:hypothetical protein
MDRATLVAFFFMHMWTIPQLVILVVGAVIALRHGMQQRFVVFAFWGCVLMALSLLMSVGQSYWMLALREDGLPASELARMVYRPKLVLLNRAMDLAGLGLILAGVVAGRQKKA